MDKYEMAEILRRKDDEITHLQKQLLAKSCTHIHCIQAEAIDEMLREVPEVITQHYDGNWSVLSKKQIQTWADNKREGNRC